MLNKPKKGRIFVISSPSGGGKTTLCAKLVKELKGLAISVSMTTREPRPGEIKGKDYFFVSKARFNDLLKRRMFLEWANVHGNNYGTPKQFVDKKLASGIDVLLVIDVQGGMQVKKNVRCAVLVFIVPPSIKALKERLKNRMTDRRDEIKKRLAIAKRELQFSKKYDYRVLNDKLDKALKKLKSIIIKERQGA